MAEAKAAIAFNLRSPRGGTIELRHLRYFLAAAQHGSFRKAASHLGVQESGISRRIRDLEDHLGASLFQRHSGGVHLTLAGERFLVRTKLALRNVHEGAGDAAAIGSGEKGKIKVGIFSSIASGFLRELFNVYESKHSGVSIELVDGNPSDHIAAIRQLRLDVAFITGTASWPGCDTIKLWSERVLLVLSSNHSLCCKDQIEWSDLTGQRFMVSDAAPGQEIRDYLIQRLADLGHHPIIQLQFVGRDNLLSFVSVGRGLTLTSEATMAMQIPGIVYRPILDETLPFSAVWSPKNDNPAARRLLSLAKSMARSNWQRTSGFGT